MASRFRTAQHWWVISVTRRLAADGVPALLCLDALVELTSLGGQRRIPLGDFITGNRKTARDSNELVTAIVVPHLSGSYNSDFYKLGARKFLVISIVMVALVVEVADGRIRDIRIAVGACSEVACRLHCVEQALAGVTLDALAVANFSDLNLSSLTPIDDIRATAQYRMSSASEIIRRMLLGLSTELQHG